MVSHCDVLLSSLVLYVVFVADELPTLVSAVHCAREARYLTSFHGSKDLTTRMENLGWLRNNAEINGSALHPAMTHTLD